MNLKVTIALVSAFFLGAGGALLIEGTPEQQARRDVARCTEIARIMVARTQQRPPQLIGHEELIGHTFACLYGRPGG